MRLAISEDAGKVATPYIRPEGGIDGTLCHVIVDRHRKDSVEPHHIVTAYKQDLDVVVLGDDCCLTAEEALAALPDLGWSRAEKEGTATSLWRPECFADWKTPGMAIGIRERRFVGISGCMDHADRYGFNHRIYIVHPNKQRLGVISKSTIKGTMDSRYLLPEIDPMTAQLPALLKTVATGNRGYLEKHWVGSLDKLQKTKKIPWRWLTPPGFRETSRDGKGNSRFLLGSEGNLWSGPAQRALADRIYNYVTQFEGYGGGYRLELGVNGCEVTHRTLEYHPERINQMIVEDKD